MLNRYRVEIYDANKLNDLTLYPEEYISREQLIELVYSNIRRFSGQVKSYLYDNKEKRKVSQAFFDESIVNRATELGLARMR